MILANFFLERCVLELPLYILFPDDILFPFDYAYDSAATGKMMLLLTLSVIASIVALNVIVIVKNKRKEGFSVKQYMVFIVAIPFIALGALQVVFAMVWY
jgi:CDP-diglyceride synthetase